MRPTGAPMNGALPREGARAPGGSREEDGAGASAALQCAW